MMHLDQLSMRLNKYTFVDKHLVCTSLVLQTKESYQKKEDSINHMKHILSWSCYIMKRMELVFLINDTDNNDVKSNPFNSKIFNGTNIYKI